MSQLGRRPTYGPTQQTDLEVCSRPALTDEARPSRRTARLFEPLEEPGEERARCAFYGTRPYIMVVSAHGVHFTWRQFVLDDDVNDTKYADSGRSIHQPFGGIRGFGSAFKDEKRESVD